MCDNGEMRIMMETGMEMEMETGMEMEMEMEESRILVPIPRWSETTYL
jgi:hypothetical protein